MPRHGRRVNGGSATVSIQVALRRVPSRARTFQRPLADHDQVASKAKGSDQAWQEGGTLQLDKLGAWHSRGSSEPVWPAASPPVPSSHPACIDEARRKADSWGSSEGGTAQNNELRLEADPDTSCTHRTSAAHPSEFPSSSTAATSQRESTGHPHRICVPALGALSFHEAPRESAASFGVAGSQTWAVPHHARPS